MTQKGIYIYIAVLWLIFGLVYLYPHPEVIAANIAPQSGRSELDEYIISGVYTGWHTAMSMLAIGLVTLFIGIKRHSSLLLSISIFSGISYTYYTTRLEVFIEQSKIALNHGVTIAASGINTILKYHPDFIYMELLLVSFLAGAIMLTVSRIKHITNRSTTDAPRRRAR